MNEIQQTNQILLDLIEMSVDKKMGNVDNEKLKLYSDSLIVCLKEQGMRETLESIRAYRLGIMAFASEIVPKLTTDDMLIDSITMQIWTLTKIIRSREEALAKLK